MIRIQLDPVAMLRDQLELHRLDENDEVVIAYKNGNYCKTNLSPVLPRLVEEMKKRAIGMEYLDCSSPYKGVESIFSERPLNFRFLFYNNPFPNGVFIKLNNLNLTHKAHNKISPVTCIEMYTNKVTRQITLGIFHFIKQVDSPPLILEASYSINDYGDLKAKNIKIKGDQERSELLFRTYLNKFHWFLKSFTKYDLRKSILNNSVYSQN